MTNQTELIQNLDHTKVEASPPAYDEALHMPRPSQSSVAITVFEIDSVPSYDEAIVKLWPLSVGKKKQNSDI